MSRRGSMLMEAVMCLPLLVMIVFAVFQITMVLLAREMTEYAAYCGARAALTSNFLQRQSRGEDAARRVLAPLALPMKKDGPVNDKYADYPGWGKLARSAGIEDRVKVSFPLLDSILGDGVVCDVTFKYPLLIPVPGFSALFGGTDPFAGESIKLTGHAVLPLPYSTALYPLQ